MDLPLEIILLIFDKLDVKSAVNLHITCSNLYNIIDDKFEMSKLMNQLYCSEWKLDGKLFNQTIIYACIKGYTDIVKFLSPFFLENGDKIAHFTVLAFNNYNKNLGYYLLKIINRKILYKFSHARDAIIKYALGSNDQYISNKIFKLDISVLKIFVYHAALLGNYDLFIKYYDYCRQICFCKYGEVMIKKKDYVFCCSLYGIKIVNGELITKHYFFKKRDNIKCKCRFGENGPYKLNLFGMLSASVQGKNKKIVEYLINMGEDDYNNGLRTAMETNNSELITYFNNLLK